MHKISTHLWFDTQAKEAARLYVSAFPGASVKSMGVIPGTPSGNVDIVNISLPGQDFTLISAGPLFRFNPSISFLVSCDSREEAEATWAKLAEGGKTLMEFGTYPFAEAYGWTEDRFGVSWQVMWMAGKPAGQKIVPTLMFVGDLCGKAEEAMGFYTSVFHEGSIGHVARYGAEHAPDREGTVAHGSFFLEGQEFGAMDSAHKHDFSFNEAVSFVVHCETQADIDEFWRALSAVPEAEQCGWLKDRYGVSWQIVPCEMEDMMAAASPEEMARFTKAFLGMKKFDVARLREAYGGKEA